MLAGADPLLSLSTGGADFGRVGFRGLWRFLSSELEGYEGRERPPPWTQEGYGLSVLLLAWHILLLQIGDLKLQCNLIHEILGIPFVRHS